MGYSEGTSDSYYEEAKRLVIESQNASTARLQRLLSTGYNRTCRLIEAMESEGVVSRMDYNGRRSVLVKSTGS